MDASIFLTESLNWILDKMDTQDAFLFIQMSVQQIIKILFLKTG